MSTWTREFLTEKNKVTRNEKRKNILGFSYSKNMATFEEFPWNISPSITPLFLKSDKYIDTKALSSNLPRWQVINLNDAS